MSALETNAAYSPVVVAPFCVVVMALDITFSEKLETGSPVQPVNERKLSTPRWRRRNNQWQFHLTIESIHVKPTHTFTAQTGSRVSPTRNVTSHNSGIDAKNFISSANPVLFSNVDRSGSASAILESVSTSGIL